jgi:hypothetical protein
MVLKNILLINGILNRRWLAGLLLNFDINTLFLAQFVLLRLLFLLLFKN